jgi:oligopeptide/dipeptide ABC transporter ATP-binding protein
VDIDPPTGHPTLLKVTDLHLSFRSRDGDVPVLRGVSLDIAPGEIVGVVGESGSGKSVTALQIARLLPEEDVRIRGGSVLLEGVDLLAAGPRELAPIRGRRIGFIFQEPMTALNPTMTVGRHLVLAIRRHTGCSRRQAWRRAVAALDEVRISAPEAVVHQYPFELSGGMRQRVVIALAMTANPALLIADEPTTALDVTIQNEVLALIRRLARDHGAAVLFVSHDLAVVSSLCERVFVMYGGEMVESGRTTDVLREPAHPYTEGLIGALPSPDAGTELIPIAGEPPNPRHPPAGCVFADRCPERFGRCDTKPPVFGYSDGHLAACWLREPTAVPPAVNQGSVRVTTTAPGDQEGGLK